MGSLLQNVKFSGGIGYGRAIYGATEYDGVGQYSFVLSKVFGDECR